jgi:ABC-type glycerol-3-phosphate transport system permease component
VINVRRFRREADQMTGLARDDARVRATPRSERLSARLSRLFRRLPLHLTIFVIMAIWLIPTFGLFVNSFRGIADMSNAGWWTALFPPSGLTLESYQQVLNTEGVANGFINSLIITIPATVIQIVIATMAGYAFAWMRFPGRDFFFIVIVLLLVVPIQMTLVPVLRMFNTAGSRVLPGGLAGASATGCRSRPTCSGTPSAACPARCSSPPRSTGRTTSRSSGGSACR